MDWPKAPKLGCIALVVLLLLFALIYFYAFRETEEGGTPTPTAPSMPVQ